MSLKIALLAKDMHNSVLPEAYSYFGKELGLKVDFHICNVDMNQFDEAVGTMRNELDGFTVTMPYKVKIMSYCDELDESAVKCGSANTIRVQDRKLIGYNTDGWGMMKFLDLQGVGFKDSKVTMVGAGGVARSIAYNLSISGVKSVDVLNIFEDETRTLVDEMGELFTGYELNDENLFSTVKGADAFINASVLGQIGYPDYKKLQFLNGLNKDGFVFDVNYSNPQAKLPAAAKKKHIRFFTGKAMSFCQGIRAMEIWTGSRPSDEAAARFIETMI